MDAIKIFDERFKPLNSYYALGCKVVKYIFGFAALALMFFFPVTDDNLFLNFYAVLAFCYTIVMHIEPYLYLKSNKVSVSVFKLMRDAPVNRKTFINSRLHYLYKYVVKLAIMSVAIRLFSIFVLEDCVSLERIIASLLGIAVCFGISVGLAVLNIYYSARY